LKQERQLLLDWFGEMVACYRERLTDAERAELHAWEEVNLGTLGTSDWPGWQKYMSKRPGAELRIVSNVRRRA
jgi:hypothetical protein